MVELLVEGWCEPPVPHALHLSTLVHQILSVIAERGGSEARTLYATLCAGGPFRQVQPELFTRLLRWIGRPDVALIEQSPDGTLLLGRQGERIVEHYTFYAVFQTPEEYRIVADEKVIGTLPVRAILTEGMTIVFSGLRWRVTEIHDRDKIINVTADRSGRPPPFGGVGGAVHDRVAEKMLEVLAGTDVPIYLDLTAAELLQNARSEFQRLDFANHPIASVGQRNRLIATGTGTVKTSTLALVLRAHGYTTEPHDGFVHVGGSADLAPVEKFLETLPSLPPVEVRQVASGRENLLAEKFHHYLGPDLLLADAASSRLDFDALPDLARRLTSAPDD